MTSLLCIEGMPLFPCTLSSMVDHRQKVCVVVRILDLAVFLDVCTCISMDSSVFSSMNSFTVICEELHYIAVGPSSATQVSQGIDGATSGSIRPFTRALRNLADVRSCNPPAWTDASESAPLTYCLCYGSL